MGIGDHAAADARRGGYSLLRRLDGALSNHQGFGGGIPARSAGPVGGLRLLQPCPQLAPRRHNCHGAARWSTTARSGWFAHAAGHRKLYRWRDRFNRVWLGCARRGCNVKRVLARVFNVADAVDTRAGERRIWELAGERLPSGKASEYNQGLMELGARICKPRNPLCDECPVNKDCQAYALGNQAERPVRKPKAAIPLHYLAAAIIRTGDSVILRKRPQEGLLGGMWEYPNVRIVERGSGEAAARRLRESVAEELGLQIQVDSQVAELKHAYTHFRVNLKAYHCRLLPESARLRERRSSRLVPLNKLGDYPMGKLDRQISQQVSKEITE